MKLTNTCSRVSKVGPFRGSSASSISGTYCTEDYERILWKDTYVFPRFFLVVGHVTCSATSNDDCGIDD